MQPGAEIPIFLALLSGPELIAILAVILVLFGATQLPELARGLGHPWRPPRIIEEIARRLRRFRLFRSVDEIGEEAGRTVGYNFAKPVYEALTHDNEAIEFHGHRELHPVNFRLWKRAISLFARLWRFVRRLTRLP